MFAQGDSVTSLSPSILEYANKLGIDPTGKNAAELKDEITLALQVQDQSDAPGAFRKFVFDYKDPMDYLATGLAATGIGVGAAAAIKSANTARKLKKIADAAKKAGEKLNPISGRKKGGVNVKGKAGFQPRNPLNPGSYNFKPTQSAVYGTGAAIGVGMLDDDSLPPPSIMPDEIQKELDKVNKKDLKKQKAESEAADKKQKEKNKKLKLDKEIVDVESIISYVQDQDKAVSEQYQKEKQEKNNRNRNIFMEQMSAALAGTDNLGDGIAIGAANAAKAVGDIEESERLAYQEFLEKEETKNTLKEDTTLKVIEKYSEQVSDLDGSMYVVGKIDKLQELYKTEGITGVTGWFSALGSDIAGFFNAEGELTDRQSAQNVVELLKARMVTQLLGEKGKTISDADRKLVEDLIGNLKSPVSNVASLIDLLDNVKETLNNSIRKQRGLVAVYEARYGERIPELSIIKGQKGVDVSSAGGGSGGDGSEIQITEDDVIQ
mgnify:CR=1 FL=1